MTYNEIKIRVGKNIKYYYDTSGWITTNIDVTEDDIGGYVNEVYTEELSPLYASRWPHLFRQVAVMDSWIMTTTVSSSSTGTTLVIPSSVSAYFGSSMEGLTVYNSTDDETAVIETYTSATTVTLDTTIGDTWDGDTIYVLGQEFAFGGDATDLLTIESVGLKYTSTETFFRKGEFREKTDLFHYGSEVGSQAGSQVYLTSIQIMVFCITP